MKWKQSFRSGGDQEAEEEETYLMTATEEIDTKGTAELDNMIVIRKEIHLKQGMNLANIFGYQRPKVLQGNEGKTDQVTLVVTEDRRKNISQVDLAYI